MAKDEPITILYCVDNAYLPQAGVAAASLLDSTPSARFDIVIAAFDRDRALSAAVFDPVMTRRPHGRIRFVDLDDDLFNDLPVTRTFSRSIYTRLVLQRFIDPDCTRVLYLDADTIVRADIRPLWQADLGGATLGAIKDHFRLESGQIGFASGEAYFNSGVLIFSMPRWRAREAERRVFAILAERGRALPWMDQDALNIALRDEIRFLDQDWNWQPRCADVSAAFLGLDEQRYATMRAAPRLIHYTTSFKPWNAAYRVHYSDLFHKAARASGVPLRLLPKSPPPRNTSAMSLYVKTKLRWHAPGIFRATRRFLKPQAAAAMYRSGPA